MIRALFFYAISIAALIVLVVLNWDTVRWKEPLDLAQLGGTVACLAIAGVMFRTASEAWLVRHGAKLSFDEDFPTEHRLIKRGLALNLRITATDKAGRTAKTEVTVRRLAKVNEVLWIRGMTPQKHWIALPITSVSHIAERQTGQFVAEDLSRWVLSRAEGWRSTQTASPQEK